MRRVMKIPLVNQSFALLAVLAVFGCDTRGVPGAGETGVPCEGCQHAQYVVSAIHIPAPSQSNRIGCDLDGDGQIDNALGRVLGGLPSVDPSFDFQRAADDSFQNGALVL